MPIDKQPKTAEEALREYRQIINDRMAEYFETTEAKLGLDLPARSLEIFNKLKNYSVEPAGKRLRGALFLFAYDYFSGSKEPLTDVAVAIELNQNYLLIVDDVMDRSPSRRGRLTTHEVLASELKNTSKDYLHQANMLAINVGLLASHMSSEILCRAKAKPGDVLAASAIFQRNIGATVYGQMEDMYNNLAQANSEAELIRLHELKVSYYSFINPIQIGAVLAGKGDSETLGVIEQFGLPAGVAFQLHDDVLGMFGDTSKTGKSNTDDLEEGKNTLLIYHTLRLAPKPDQEIVKNALGNPHITEKEHRQIQAIIEGCGARALVEKRAESARSEALAKISGSKVFDTNAQKFLSEMLDFVVSRNN